MYFKVKLADIVFDVECFYESTRVFCKDYVIGCEGGYFGDINIANELYKVKAVGGFKNWSKMEPKIRITDEDIRNEHSRSSDRDENSYSDKYIETLALQRKISGILPAYDCFLMHGAVAAVNGAGYMFTATSGTGKSTHVNLWKKYFDEVEIINGDKPFIRISDEEVRAYGTPWAGKEGWQVNRSVPLRAVCLLKRGTENKIKRISPVNCLPFLMRQVHYTDDPQIAGKTMELFNQMLDRITVYELECDVSREAAEYSYREMTK